MTLTGKGYYIWQVRHCENGDPDRIAALAQEANLSHVLVKIADGTFPYNIDLDNGFDYARPVINKLKAKNIQVWGWQYVYGDFPDQEAEIAVSRALELGVNGFVVNAEGQYSSTSKAPAASRYMSILRNNLGSTPIALSSYRYPSYHRNLPWTNFLDRCDYNMPQVYWVQSHNNAGAQLQRCVNEFKNIRPFRPIIPTGPTFKESGWIPTNDEVIEFMEVAKQLNLSAVNFWYWEGCRRYMTQFWDLVRDYKFDAPTQASTLPEQYIEAMNNKDPNKVIDFYSDQAVHIRAEAAVQGKNAIKKWIASLINEYSDNKLRLVSEIKDSSVYSFQWTGTDQAGKLNEGHETVGLVDNKISYHYSFSKQIDSQP